MTAVYPILAAVAAYLLGSLSFAVIVTRVMGLSDPLYTRLNLPPDATLDSNLRFYSGVWLEHAGRHGDNCFEFCVLKQKATNIFVVFICAKKRTFRQNYASPSARFQRINNIAQEKHLRFV